MSPDVRLEKVNNIAQQNETAAVQKSEKPVGAIPIIHDGGGTDNDIIKESYGFTDYTQLTEQEKNKFIMKAVGIDDSEFSMLPEREKELYNKCLDSAVKFLTKSGKEINAADLINKTQEYIIAKRTGWGDKYDFSKFESAQANNRQTLEDFVGKFSPEIRKKGFENVSQEERQRALKAAFNSFFDQLEKNGKNHDYIVKAQMQTFGRILVNAGDEERVMFKEVVKQLLAENVREGDRAVLESLDKIELKQAYVDSFTYEDEKELINSDRYGNTVSKDDLEAVYTEHKKYQSKEVIEKTHEDFQEDAKEFFEENKEIIETIKEKNLRGEELTEEEEKIQYTLENFYESYAASESAGTAVNVCIEEAVKTKLLAQFNYDNYSLGEDFYRSVIEEINYIAKTNPDIITMSEEDFTKLMDSATDGNFTRVLNDIEQNIHTDLSIPENPKNKSGGETENAAGSAENKGAETSHNSSDIQNNFYNTKNYSKEEINEKINLINEKKYSIQTNEKEEIKTQKLSTNNLQSNKAYKETVEENGLIPTIKFIFKNFDKIATSVTNTAIGSFKTLSNAAQANLIQTSGGKGLREMLKNVSSFAVLNKIDSDKMFNMADEEVVDEKIQKQKELTGL